MNRSLATHAFWIAITVGTFFAGSHWSRTSDRNRDAAGEDDPAVGKPGIASSSRSTDEERKRSGKGNAASRDDSDKGGSPLPGNIPYAVARRILSTAPLVDKAEIEALVQDATKGMNPIIRRHAFDRILESINPENVMMIRAAMAGNGARSEQWQLLDYAWGASDPAGALAHIPDVPDRYRDGFIPNLLPGIASVDPAAAIAYVEGLEAGDRREQLTGRVIEGLADHDIGAATDYVFQLDDGGNETAGRHLSDLTRDIMRSEGLEFSREWAEALPAGALQAGALDRVAHEFVDRDPQAAAVWATRYAGEDYAARVIEEVGDEWAERDPPSAVAWLNTLPSGRGQNEGMSSALHEWAQRDPVAAGGYLQEMPPSTARDAAVGGFSATIAREDPQTAISWAETISAPESRLRTLTRVGQTWARQDPAAATAWATASGLPEATQQAIMNPPRDRR